MPFAMLPPEINSGRMYAGPGSGPMLAAAAAWDRLAVELGSAAACYESVISELSTGWLGPASTSMTAAAAPYAAWLHTAAAQAEHAATHAKAAATAYETAFAMTVAPPVVAANRARLAALVATNLLGQNTPAIAATEAHYSQMWAQDTNAMYGYAANSAAASTLTPFSSPNQATNPGGLSNQAAAIAQATGATGASHAHTAISSISAIPQALQSLASSGAQSPTLVGSTVPAAMAAAPAQAIPAATLAGFALELSALGADAFGTFVIDSVGTFGIDTVGTFAIDGAEIPIALGEAATRAIPPGVAAPIMASVGHAASVGRLSVPPSWTVAAPAFHTVAAALPNADTSLAAQTAVPGAAGNTFADMATAGMAGRALGSSTPLVQRERSKPSTRNRPQPARRSLRRPVTSIAAELRKLAQLHDSGKLTEEEFTQQKQRLLGN